MLRFKAMRHLGVSSPANSCGGAHQLCAIPVQSGGLSSILRLGVPRLQKSERLSFIWPWGAPRVLRGACLSFIDPWGAPKMTFGVYNIICPKRQRRSAGRCSGRTLNIIRAPFFHPPLMCRAGLSPHARLSPDSRLSPDVRLSPDAPLNPDARPSSIWPEKSIWAEASIWTAASIWAEGSILAEASIWAGACNFSRFELGTLKLTPVRSPVQ